MCKIWVVGPRLTRNCTGSTRWTVRTRTTNVATSRGNFSRTAPNTHIASFTVSYRRINSCSARLRAVLSGGTRRTAGITCLPGPLRSITLLAGLRRGRPGRAKIAVGAYAPLFATTHCSRTNIAIGVASCSATFAEVTSFAIAARSRLSSC